MDVRHLIDDVVQRTMVLIAQLATADGVRAPLASVADQVFLDLIAELEQQGVRRKVVADMFGLALRSYQKRVQRLSEGRTDRGASLWTTLLTWLQKQDAVTREQVLERFKRDDEAAVKAILADLVEQGLVFKAGSGSALIYRAATVGELDLQEVAFGPALAALIWLTVYRHGPMTLAEVADRHRRLTPAHVEQVLVRGVAEGMVVRSEDPEPHYFVRHFLPVEQGPTPWAVAVSDHFTAVVTTLCRSLAKAAGDPWASAIGGSTYTFDLYEGHPHADEVLALLARVRGETSRLRTLVTAHNDALAASSGPAPEGFRVTFYVGGHAVEHRIPSYFPDATTPDGEEP